MTICASDCRDRAGTFLIHPQDLYQNIALGPLQTSTFHVPNLLPSIKYMKRSMFKSVQSDMSHLGLWLVYYNVTDIIGRLTDILGKKDQ